MSKTKTLSLYLAKDSVNSADDILTETAQNILKVGHGERVSAPGFAEDAALFVFPGIPVVPKWVGTLSAIFPITTKLTAQSPCGIVAFREQGRYFAITFSYGHVYLDDAQTEADFGLRVAINAVSDSKLRSVERSNLGAAIRDFAQAAGQKELRAFGFDEALDLIRKVSGTPTDTAFANVVTGARSLRFSKKMEIEDVPAAAKEALVLFGKNSYQSTSFKIIDFLSPVLDPTLAGELDLLLLQMILDESDEFEIAIPEIIPTEAGTFRFENVGRTAFYPDLSLEIYRDALGANLASLSVDDLKRHKIGAFSDAGDHRVAQWSIKNSLAGTLVKDGIRYALNEGFWYRLDEAFRASAENGFSQRVSAPDATFTPFKKVASLKTKGKKTKIYYQSEESYNEDIAKNTKLLLLDQKLIGIAEQPGPGIEACDLLDIPGRRFIHVKKSSRQSSVLSHFFKQGGNSAQMLRRYEPFRTALVEKVRTLYGDAAADELEGALGDTWTVEFQIADSPRKDGTYSIPFFSKLTLKDAARDMEAMGFKVAIRFIKLAPP